ncbi:M20/M25/M40 family metallo-hydrolase [Streptomyces sp. UNOC14_S4]|uniref:M20/M25/M40 family metallo-hydrolase n=1 Tax=Streptomyces sp. UNOC14_S4 TaxID=2872340 RepID=UPI001E456F36|nr:M20/M25/M40 family metallo-hydrolase [Streptomyces sp. UNOC14_S4]MCC3766765.1 M20/M25/M40 family metallo-hydrolase [Streptomyces sp. UNOC14_S4]
MNHVPLLPSEHELLIRLLELPTVGLLEAGADGPRPRLAEAQLAYADAAAELGFTVVHHGAPPPSELERPDVPRVVREAMAEIPDFLECQPSTVLRLGPELPRERTIMFNVHLDTVSGWEPPRYTDRRFHGRGAIDDKGPAVALLAALRTAVDRVPELGRTTGVLIQLVAGEEGGAMGVFGTRPLIEQGFYGRINLFCEPTGSRLLPRSTAAMTARVTVDGLDSIDDRPGGGHNATVLLGYLAQHLAHRLSGRHDGTRVCVAGLRTGPLHNRVYGTGELLLNLAYENTTAGQRLEAALEAEVERGLADFTERFGQVRDFALTADEASGVTAVEWLKRGLPALVDQDDPWARSLLTTRAGLPCVPADEPSFTCDAIWLDGVPGAYTAAFGPGDLDLNHAHAQGEFADARELETYAASVVSLLSHFARATNGRP